MDPASTLASARTLASQGLHRSVQLLAGLLLSDRTQPKTRAQECETLALYAESLAEGGEHRRSLKYYERALDLFHSHLPASNRLDQLEIKVLGGYANACIRTGELYKAKGSLESLEERRRSPSIWRQLAWLYDELGEIKAAIQCHKAILRANPDAVESAISLLDHAVPYAEVELLVSSQQAYQTVRMFIQAHAAARKHEHSAALQILTSLENMHPFCVDIQLEIAMCHVESGNSNAARLCYTKIRKLEPDTSSQMDIYAGLLQAHGKVQAVNNLAEDLFHISEERPEPWLAMARYCEMKGHLDQALYFVEKATVWNSRHVPTYHLKGSLLLAMNRPADAILSYRSAYRISRDVVTYEGIIESYLALGQTNQAVAAANEALRLMPKSARVLTLMGVVFEKVPTKAGKAREFLDKALRVDPNCIEAIFALAHNHESHDSLDAAITLLEEHLPFHHNDTMHLRLAHLYLKKQDYSKATEHYHAAQRINPECLEAKAGLEKTDKLINGTLDHDDDDELDDGMDLAEESMGDHSQDDA
ncbi:hypothetical protein BC831DRAFT_21414 [Entophlyctis helioformis]|nr:hypothetical protein BC831DRAFT_21414 [Entophlyctis helioformis]